MSYFEEQGLSANIHDPLVMGGNYLESLGSKIDSYSHTISAYGGFDTASIGLSDNAYSIEEWMERGLGRHIEIYGSQMDTGQSKTWEGFVDSVDINIGALTVHIGALTDIANRVAVTYDQIDTAYNPPTELGRQTTAVSDDTISQSRYGIWDKVFQGGKCTSVEALNKRGRILAGRAQPARTQTTGNAGASNAVINLKGYYYWLSAYRYMQTATSGTSPASTQIQAALAADTNAIFSTDYSRLSTNALAVKYYENDDTPADSYVKDIVGMGDTSYNRWTFGIYENRRAVYAQAPATIKYQQSIQSRDASVFTLAGELVRPWAVRPGEYLFLNDFLVGKPLGASLDTDLRCLFIEQVSYTLGSPAPVITSGDAGQLAQVLAQMNARGAF
jgi:hypothetical protein